MGIITALPRSRTLVLVAAVLGIGMLSLAIVVRLVDPPEGNKQRAHDERGSPAPQ